MGQKVKLLPSMNLRDKEGSKNKKEIKKQLFRIQESGRIVEKEDKEVWALIVKNQVSTPFLQEEKQGHQKVARRISPSVRSSH